MNYQSTYITEKSVLQSILDTIVAVRKFEDIYDPLKEKTQETDNNHKEST